MFIVDVKENPETGDRTRPFVMICHPKTGSQSMQQVLRKTFSARPVRGMHYIDEDECQRILDNGGLIASTVRNPWDLMVSWYFYSEHDPKYNGKHPTIEAFKPWLFRVLEAGNGWIEKGLFYGVEHCNRIFRFEHDLERQLNQCLMDCGLETVKFPHVAKTNHTHYSHYYDEESACAVALRFSEEIKEWGYMFDKKSEKVATITNAMYVGDEEQFKGRQALLHVYSGDICHAQFNYGKTWETHGWLGFPVSDWEFSADDLTS